MITRKPVCFYKFVPFDRKDILENGLIRFTPIGSFNDPFELEPTITPLSSGFLEYASNFSEKELQEIKLTDEDLAFSSERADMTNAYREKYKKQIGKYGVLSLSSNASINPLLTVAMPEKEDPRTNILMWSHYGDSHKGFVIEFRDDFIDGISFEKVEYSEERHILTFEDIETNKFDNIFLRKSIEWRHEQEYRAIFPLEKCAKIKDNDIHLFEIRKSSVKSITFGCAMSEENKVIIKNIIAQDSEFDGITLCHARLSKEGYFLDFDGEYGDWTNGPKFGAVTIPIQKKL